MYHSSFNNHPQQTTTIYNQQYQHVRGYHVTPARPSFRVQNQTVSPMKKTQHIKSENTNSYSLLDHVLNETKSRTTSTTSTVSGTPKKQSKTTRTVERKKRNKTEYIPDADLIQPDNVKFFQSINDLYYDLPITDNSTFGENERTIVAACIQHIMSLINRPISSHLRAQYQTHGDNFKKHTNGFHCKFDHIHGETLTVFEEGIYHDKKRHNLPEIYSRTLHIVTADHFCLFILQIMLQGYFTSSTLVIACIIMDRLLESRLAVKSSFVMRPSNWRPIFITSILIADKYFEDKPVKSSSLSKLFDVLSPLELNHLENVLVSTIEFEVLVSQKLFKEYCANLIREFFSMLPSDNDPHAKTNPCNIIRKKVMNHDYFDWAEQEITTPHEDRLKPLWDWIKTVPDKKSHLGQKRPSYVQHQVYHPIMPSSYQSPIPSPAPWNNQQPILFGQNVIMPQGAPRQQRVSVGAVYHAPVMMQPVQQIYMQPQMLGPQVLRPSLGFTQGPPVRRTHGLVFR